MCDGVNHLRSRFRNLAVRARQNVLTRRIPGDTRKLIIFLTPSWDQPSGGVFSIVSLYQESVRLRKWHDAEVVLCAIPGEPPLLKYEWFENDDCILRLDTLLHQCDQLESLLIHIPELFVNQVAGWLASESASALKKVKNIHLNVMLQNVDLLQGQNISGLGKYGKVTCTTGHVAYSNASMRKRLGVPLHQLLVFYRPEQFTRLAYEEKEPIFAVSHDDHPLKETILNKIATVFPDLNIRILGNLKFDEYKDLLRRAKWSLTFGEGLDGYFVETVFSGGISFAVFNDRFFSPEFAALKTVYSNWDILEKQITNDLSTFDQPDLYRECWEESYSLLASIYNSHAYQRNLREFYQENYTLA